MTGEAEAEAWAWGEVGTALDRARDENRMVTLAELQEAAGLGHGDLRGVLDALRERGDAVEGAPGEWRRPFEDELRDADVAERAEPAPEVAVEVALPASPFAEPGVTGRRAASRIEPGAGEVVLTRRVAEALDAATMGALVHAGIAEAVEAGRTFVLRVG